MKIHTPEALDAYNQGFEDGRQEKAADHVVAEILAESDEKVWRGLERRVHAAIRERDGKLAERLREIAEPDLHARKSDAQALLSTLADILEADD